jgi:hypothetical protein
MRAAESGIKYRQQSLLPIARDYGPYALRATSTFMVAAFST